MRRRHAQLWMAAAVWLLVPLALFSFCDTYSGGLQAAPTSPSSSSSSTEPSEELLVFRPRRCFHSSVARKLGFVSLDAREFARETHAAQKYLDDAQKYFREALDDDGDKKLNKKGLFFQPVSKVPPKTEVTGTSSEGGDASGGVKGLLGVALFHLGVPPRSDQNAVLAAGSLERARRRLESTVSALLSGASSARCSDSSDSLPPLVVVTTPSFLDDAVPVAALGAAVWARDVEVSQRGGALSHYHNSTKGGEDSSSSLSRALRVPNVELTRFFWGARSDAEKRLAALRAYAQDPFYTLDGDTAFVTLWHWDFGKALQAMDRRFRYTLAIENDAIAGAAWQRQVHSAINQANNAYGENGWAYLWLYRSESMEPELHELPLQLFAVVVSSICVGWLVGLGSWIVGRLCATSPLVGQGYAYVVPRRGRQARGSISSITCALRTSETQIFSVSIASALIFAALVVGRGADLFAAGLQDMIRGFDCCTPAMLYNNKVARPLFDELAAIKPRLQPLDMTMRDFSEQNSLRRAVFTPSVFQHAGFESTRGGGSRTADTWRVQQSATFQGTAPLDVTAVQVCLRERENKILGAEAKRTRRRVPIE